MRRALSILLLALGAPALAPSAAADRGDAAARVASVLSRLEVHGRSELAVEELGRLGPGAVPELVGALVGARGARAEVLLGALSEARPDRVSLALQAELDGAPTLERRRMALRVLGVTGRAHDLELCLNAASASADELALELRATLTAMVGRDAGLLPELASYWPSLDDATRDAAARACAEAGGGPAAEFLAGLLGGVGSSDGMLLAQLGRCAEGLPRASAEAVAERVRPYVADDREHAGVRKSAAILLGRLEDDAAVPALVRMLEESSGGLAQDAHWALCRITTLSLPRDAGSWSAWHRREAAWWTRRAGVAFSDLSAREPLIAAAAVREVSDHRLGRHALARELSAGLRHTHPGVRAQTVDALVRLGSREAVPALVEALEDRDDGVRRACHEALRALTGKDHGASPAGWSAMVAAR